MANLSYKLNFEKLFKKLSMGSLKKEPQQVFGGLMNEMYKVVTEKGEYAVKALNPQIMQRKTAMNNHIFADHVTRIAYNRGINTIPAIEVNGKSIHEVDGQYYLIFPWFNGKALDKNTVDINKCKLIGEMLAKIHNLDFSSISISNENNFTVTVTDWNMYAEKGNKENLLWGNELYEKADTLYQIEKRANSAFKKVTNNLVISHRDLDPKNVLWDQDGIPMIIDWDAAGYVNPSVELLEVALYWSGGESETPDKEAFCAVIDSYINKVGAIEDNLEDVLYSIFKGKLEWLKYNINRSLRIECSSDEEQKLGTKEVVETIQSIFGYSKLIPVLLEWL
ncbi:phosphotransferase enzyme family protein [Oceanirhabdus sp. W0125-5]|uniref:phosphotransferase enzyme family protein n=1 Tax=Oceanirhabdus sp. W0125-5 TaxID=2999116 RepID=UPI0022F3079B|nr:phosphotransferase [Oceanirhabdus sp. W0125-5]WBW98106.1 phosphotransferase [Oceanirhabdus sp. W0125-5]